MTNIKKGASFFAKKVEFISVGWKFLSNNMSWKLHYYLNFLSHPNKIGTPTSLSPRYATATRDKKVSQHLFTGEPQAVADAS